MSKNVLSVHRKWNTLAFRGRLMSLLAPARGMSKLRPRQEVCKRWPQRPYLACLPLKLGGFSRPSSFTHSAPARGVPTLAAKAVFSWPSLENIHLGLISPRSLAYSSCWVRVCYPPSKNMKHCLVDWNGRRRLLENTDQFSSCDVTLP